MQILALIQSAVVHAAVNHGLGRHRQDLDSVIYVYYSKVWMLFVMNVSNPDRVELSLIVIRQYMHLSFSKF